MSSEEVINTADIFLREVPNVKINNINKYEPPRPPVKEEMQILRLSDGSVELVMETLKYIHGDDFVLKEASSYKDKGAGYSNKYWMERGNLVIKGCCDYSQMKDEPESELDRFKMFAVMRLESYGFHKNHCEEALDYCNGEVDDALHLLYEKYFKVKKKEMEIEHDYSEKELLEQRIDEKGVLESIYEKSFNEKILSNVWTINSKLEYLIKMFSKRKTENKNANYSHKHTKKKDKCRNFVKDRSCKYGSNCKFSHEEEPKPDINAHLSDYKFDLEIRFPKNTKYPFEAPLIFFKTNLVLPELLNLHICKRLHQEAEQFAIDGIASVYAIVELLQNEEEILTYIKNTKIQFLSPNEKLFPTLQEIDLNRLKRPSHYKKGLTSRDSKKHLTIKQIENEDRRIVENFKRKYDNATYAKMMRSRETLPAWKLKKTILNTIKSSQIVVISGETGCGKSTQVPQFILDDWLGNYNNNHIELVCTQPRRISAIGVADRVADERAEKVGDTVGYQIRLESKVSSSTRLTFCTTGILLRRLESDPTLANVSHIIVDEVHERSEESDFLLLILRDLLPLRPDLKIILMSATLNANLFSDYFGDIPVLEIPGRTFPVEQYFLEDILEVCDYVLEENSQFTRNVKLRGEDLNIEMDTCDINSANAKPKDIIKDDNLTIQQVLARYKGFSMTTCKNMYLLDPMKVNMELIESVLTWIVSGEHDYPREGSILIFLPGIAEITSLYDQLCEHPDFNPRSGDYVLVPLHSSLTSEEQALVFKKPPRGARKIVLSTNIAETSVTIDDCIFVIDSGKMKEKHFDSNRNMESLETVWVTRANALQRKGRAGRVTSGVCIHLYTGHRYKHHMLSQPIPEIHRVPLEQLLLNIKVLPNFAGRNLHDVLGRTIEPPVKENIDSAITRLQNVGAFDKENNLTPLGHHLAALPVDVRIGKLMLFGAIFSCVDSALTMAACLSYKSPFVTPFGKKEQANLKKREFSIGFSDQMTVLRAYRKFQEANSKSFLAGQNFANENYLSRKTLITIADIKYQFLELLISIGFVPIDLGRKRKSGQDNILTITGSEFNKNGENTRLLSSIMCAALFPNVVKVLTPEKSFISSSTGAVPRQPEAKELRFKTKQEQVFLHPSSVNHIVRHFPSPYLVYQEKVKTSKIFIRDCCMVPLVPLVLFSGYDVDISVHNGNTFLVLEDNWIMFQVEDHKIAEILKMIRTELLDLLEEKIKDPLLNILHHDKGEKIVSTILQLVTID